MFNSLPSTSRLFRGLVAVAAAVFLTGPSFGQTPLQFKPSSLSSSATTYTPLAAGIPITMDTVTLSGDPTALDEGLSPVTPIGFTFPFNGENCTNFIMSTNGWIKVGGAGLTKPNANNGTDAAFGSSGATISTTTGALTNSAVSSRQIISPFNMDIDVAPANILPDNFSYELSGVSPNQVLTIQWKNVNDFGATPNYGVMNFQVKLHETTGVIDFVYGTFTVGPAAANNIRAAGVGVRGNGENSEHALMLVKGYQTAWAAAVTIPASTAGNNVTHPLSAYWRPMNTGGNSAFNHRRDFLPVPGRMYTLTPVAVTQLPYSAILAENTTTTWTPITGGTTYTPVDAGAAVNWDDGITPAAPIGFSFTYNGTAYTDVRISTNGMLKFGTGLPSAYLLVGNGVSQGPTGSISAADYNMVYPFNANLTSTDVANREIRVETSGGVCTIQWKAFRDATAPQIIASATFQVKLYQATGVIEFVYGNWTATGDATPKGGVSIGLKGNLDHPAQWVAVAKGGVTSPWNTATFNRSPHRQDGAANNVFQYQMAGAANLLPVNGQTFRFTPAVNNDLAVTNIYTLGKSPLVYGSPQEVGGSIRNVGLTTTAATTATFTAGAPNATSFSEPIPSLTPGQTYQFMFTSTFSPTNAGQTPISVSVPSDGNNTNNSKGITQEDSARKYSYKYPGVPAAGGLGFNGGTATGNFVARFSTSQAADINAVTVDFNGGPNEYRLGIWAENLSLPGRPGTLLYTSPANELSPVGGGSKEIAFCNPVSVPAGNFFVGLRQINPVQNIQFAWQNESPIRQNNTFWNNGAVGATQWQTLGGTNPGDASSGWNQFNANSQPFRLNIEVQLEVGVLTPNCATVTAPTDGATFVSKNPKLQWGSGGGNTKNYDVYLGTSPTLGPGDLILFETCNQTYQAGLIGGLTYYWKVVAKNTNGTAIGCNTWSFTTAPDPANDNCSGAIPLTVCAPAATNGWTVNATQSLGVVGSACAGDPNDDVWYIFKANSNVHRITVVPSATLDPVVEVRSAASCGTSTYLTCFDNTANGAQESLNITGFTPGTDYYIRVYGWDTAGTEGTFTIRVGTDGGWTGQVSSDYNTAGNWCDNLVPTSLTTATIRNVAPAFPQPVLAVDKIVNNLTMDAGAALTINSGITLDVRNTGTAGGNLSGPAAAQGTGYITGAGTVRMSAGGTQPFQTMFGKVQLPRLTIANTGSAGVVVDAAARPQISDQLDLQPSAKIDNLGTITFRSTSGGTARFADITTGTYTSSNTAGMFEVQRYINPGSGRWGLLGSPVQNAALTQWSELNTVINPMNNASLFYFDETDMTADYDNFSLDTVARYGWTIPANLVGGMNPGGNIRGWRAYIRSNFGGTVSVTGTPYVGNVNVPVTFSNGQYDGGGWNLIANPYASTIDWNNVTVPAAVNDAVFVFNGTAYQTYVKGSGTAQGVTVNNATRFIPSSQGFFIKTTAATSIQFQENDKTATAASYMREDLGEPVNQLRLTLKNSAGVSDETVVRFFDEATPGFDLRGDAGKPWGYVANLYSMDRDGKNYTVNSLPEVMSGRTIVPLGVEVYASGTYTITLTQLESFPANVSIRLRDKLNNTLVNPRLQPTYTFNVSSVNPATQGRNRFEVIFDGAITANKGLLSNAQGLHIWPNPAASSAKANFAVQGFGSGKARAEVIDAMGRLVQTQNIVLNGSGETVYTIGSGLPAGHYTLRVVSGSEAAVSAFTIE